MKRNILMTVVVANAVIALAMIKGPVCLAALSPEARIELENEFSEIAKRYKELRLDLLHKVPPDRDGAEVLWQEMRDLTNRQIQIAMQLG